MAYKELLDSVRFEDVEPYIVKMDPEAEPCLGWYKIHFDMLRLLTPMYHEDANDKVCKITMSGWQTLAISSSRRSPHCRARGTI